MKKAELLKICLKSPKKINPRDNMKVADIKKVCKQKGIKGYSKLKKAELYELCIVDNLNKILKDKYKARGLRQIDASIIKIKDKFSENSPDMIVKHTTKRVKGKYKISDGTYLMAALMLTYLSFKHGNDANFYAKSDIRKILNEYHKDKKQNELEIGDYSIEFYFDDKKNANPDYIVYPPKFKKKFKEYRKDKKRFSFFLLTLYSDKLGHANMLVLDNLHNTIYRFEPHGTSFNYNTKKSDAMLKREFKKIDKTIEYVSLTDFCPLLKVSHKKNKIKAGPQTIGENERKAFRKGDTAGFCLYWSVMLMDFIMTNYKRKNYKDKTVPEYLDIMMREIATKYVSFNRYIRSYAVFLTEMVKNFKRVKNINTYIQKVINDNKK